MYSGLSFVSSSWQVSTVFKYRELLFALMSETHQEAKTVIINKAILTSSKPLFSVRRVIRATVVYHVVLTSPELKREKKLEIEKGFQERQAPPCGLKEEIHPRSTRVGT